MRTEHLPMKMLFAGILAITVGGCGTSSGDDDDTGGTTGGAEASGGAAAGGSGGSVTTTGGTGQSATGGTTSTGGTTASGGSQETGQAGTGGPGGAETAGNTGTGGGPTGGASSGGFGTGGTTGGGGGATGGSTGTCTPSKDAGKSVSGSGPHNVSVETNSDPGIEEGTIYRPADLGGAEKYPIFAWGEGGCTLDGRSNSAAMAEIASHGYFVIADGTPNGSGSRSSGDTSMGEHEAN